MRKWLCILTIFSLYSCSGDNPFDPPQINLNVGDCLIETSGDSFEILTWNVQKFPLKGGNTISELTKIIKDLNVDLIAFQEISDQTSFENLLEELPGWQGEIEISGDLNLAYLYKSSEITLITKIKSIYRNDNIAFPRPPVIIEVIHQNGISVTLINIHLKCCGGPENFDRRKDASEKLKQYIDENMADEPLVLLGDFNDLISGSSFEDNPFFNFVIDSMNYTFTDAPIAAGTESNWSYPSWPSHIDHILVTNELFPQIDTTLTLVFDQCDSNYPEVISDHRPLMLLLKK